MPSEYDFLLPYSHYSRPLRREGRARRMLLLAGAFGVGALATALIIALPLRPISQTSGGKAERADKVATTATSAQPPAPTSTQPPAQEPQRPARAVGANPPEAVGASKRREAATESAASAPAKATTERPVAVSDRPRETTGLAPPAAPSSPPTVGATDAIPEPRPRSLALISLPPAPPSAGGANSSPGTLAEPPAQKPAAAPDAAITERPATRTRRQAAPRSERSVATSSETPATERHANRSSETLAAASGDSPAATSTSRESATPSGETAAARSEAAQPRSEQRTARSDRRRIRNERAYMSRPEPRRYQERRIARTRDDSRVRDDWRDGREFVDSYGVRRIILPRGWSPVGSERGHIGSERGRVAADTADDRGWRPRRFFIFGPPDYDY
jgi:hypothetical protein